MYNENHPSVDDLKYLDHMAGKTLTGITYSWHPESPSPHCYSFTFTDLQTEAWSVVIYRMGHPIDPEMLDRKSVV